MEMFKEAFDILLCKNTSDAVILLNNKGRIMYVNPSFEKMFGYSRESVHHTPINDLLADKTYYDIYFENLRAFRKKKALRKVLAYRKYSGEFIYLDTKIIPYTDTDSDSAYFLIGKDISRIIDQSQRITLLEFELNKANSSLQTLLYKSSHDLRGPISTIHGLINIAKADIDQPQVLSYLDMISQSAHKLDHLLIEIRNLSIIHSNNFNSEDIDFHHLLEEIINEISKFISTSDIDLNIHIGELKHCFFSKFLLDKILYNIIDNACRYRRSKNHKVDIIISGQKKYLNIKVSDNGTGIKKEHFDHIFEMLYKGHSCNNNNGLGLAIARSATEKLSGTIEITSEYGHGTTAEVNLPF